MVDTELEREREREREREVFFEPWKEIGEVCAGKSLEFRCCDFSRLFVC
jgi:hypothetical protein